METTKENKLRELNKRLILEVKTLRAEDGTLKRHNGEISYKNKELEEQIERLEAEKITTLKEFEETKEDFGKRMQLMQAEIQARDKALEITKKKEIDHLAELARSKQENEGMSKEVFPFSKEEMPDLSQASSSAKSLILAKQKGGRQKGGTRTLHLHLQQRTTNKVSFLTLSPCATIAIQ